MALPTYSTGTVSVAAGGTVVTGVGGLWSGINAKQGDFLSINNVATVLITEVTDATHLKITPWPGAAQTGQPYVIYQNYVGRVVGVAAAEDVGDMLEMLHVDGLPFIVGVDETVPDPSYGDDGQFAFKPSTGQWWTKTGGAWVSSPGLSSDATKVLKAGDIMTGNLIVPAIELGQNGTIGTPYLDFHSSANSNDYDTRIIASAGGASPGLGSLSITAGLVNVGGDLSWTGTAWTAYTPTVTITGGAGSATGFYKKYGKMLALEIVLSVTGSGSAAFVSLPAGMSSVHESHISGRERDATGFGWNGYLPGASSTFQLRRGSDNAATVSAGMAIVLNGIVEAA